MKSQTVAHTMKVIQLLCEKAKEKELKFNVDSQCVWIKYPQHFTGSKQRYEFGELIAMALTATLSNNPFDLEIRNPGRGEVYLPVVEGNSPVTEGEAFRAFNHEARLLLEREAFFDATALVMLGRMPTLNENPKEVAYADILTAYPNGTFFRMFLPKNFFFYAAITENIKLRLVDAEHGSEYKKVVFDSETFQDYSTLLRECFDEVQMKVLSISYRKEKGLPENVTD